MSKIIPIAVVTVVLVLLVTAAMTIVDDPDGYDLYYDDYVAIDQSCEGSDLIEVVEVRGQQYLHAVGVGETTIKVDGQTIPITVHKADLDVFLITGQSNSGNYDYNQLDTAVPALGTAYYYGTYRALCYPGYSISSYNPDLCDMRAVTSDSINVPLVADKSTVFSKDYYEATGHKVYWICGGIGGASITKFSPTYGTGEIYSYEQQLLDDAIGCVDTDCYNIHIRDYLWIQGEADAELSIDTYKDCFTEWNTALTSDSSFYESMANWQNGSFFGNCYISLIPPEYANSYNAQIDLANTIQNVHISTKISETFTVQNGLLNSGDGVHYTQAGDNLIAKYLAASAASEVEDKHPVVNSLSVEDDTTHTLVGVIFLLLIVAIVFIVARVILSREV